MDTDELENKLSGFGEAPRKMEGQGVWIDGSDEYEQSKPEYETTYVEVSMPVALEEMAHAVMRAMRTQWMIDNGHEEDIY